MNYLKACFRVKLGLSNPYEINPSFKIFNKTHQNQVKVKLIGRHRINYDSYILSFELPEPHKCLGLKSGEYVDIECSGQKRSYVPISTIDQPDTIDFLVRDLRQKNKDSFTGKLLDLEINSAVSLVGPYSKYIYKGFGKVEYEQDCEGVDKKVVKQFRNIGIITHASGITTTFSLIDSISMNFDNTGVTLFWIGDKEQDFVFLEELADLVDQSKLNLNLMLTTFQKGWVGPYGNVTKKHLTQFLPPQEDSTFILMSALEGDLKQVKGMVRQLGYNNFLYA